MSRRPRLAWIRDLFAGLRFIWITSSTRLLLFGPPRPYPPGPAGEAAERARRHARSAIVCAVLAVGFAISAIIVVSAAGS